MRRCPTLLSITGTFASLLLALFTACSPGGGAGAPEPTPVAPPSALTYPANPATYTLGLAIAANTPTHGGGAVASYAVSPVLPAGLALNADTGSVTGTPTALAPPAAYMVTATNAGGSTTATLALAVNDVAPADLAYESPSATYTIGTAIAANTPTNSGGAVVSYGVSPTLPAGLAFSTATGAITGTPSAQTAQANYTVTATNSGGSATANVSITVQTAPGIAPVFTLQPASVSIIEGQNTQFAVSVTGTPTPTLAWQVSVNTGPWADIGVTTPVFDVLGATVADSGRQFRVVASNSAGTAISNTAVLTVRSGAPLASIVFERQYGLQSSPSDLFLIKEDGSGEIALADSADHENFVALAPGRRVIYRRFTGGNYSYYRVNADGTGTLLLAGNQGNLIFNGITPAGWVIYRVDTATGNRDLYGVDATSSTPTVIPLATGPNHEDFAGMTADGKVIYSEGDDLYITNADGTNRGALASEPNYKIGLLGETPSGQLVYYTASAYGMGGIYRIDAGGGPAVPLAINTAPWEFDYSGITRTGQVIIRKMVAGQPDLYGDGTVPLATSPYFETYLASTASGQVIYGIEDGPQRGLYIVNADGSSRTKLSDSIGFLAFTLDGRVIYAKEDTAGQYDIYMVNADGTGTVPIATSADYEAYKGITPDGHVIYERTGAANVTYLYAYNPSDGATTPLVTSGGHAFFVGTTPSGKVLFRRASGNADLYIVNVDGTGVTPLANTGNNEFFAAVFP